MFRFLGVLSLILVILGGYLVYTQGTLETNIFTIRDLGFSVRLDALNIIILAMINIIGLIVIRYSYSYLEGEKRHAIFIGRLAATIGSVQLFVLSGNIFMLFAAWVLTSITLHHLILFYRDRHKAQTAAFKKFVIARVGDASLLIAFILIYLQFGTGNLESIFEQLKSLPDQNNASLEIAALLMALTAVLKSAQIPFHGWLVEVMEAPTPVSALLHAGLINAGPFLMIRFSYLLDATEYASFSLFVIGALSASFGALVFVTQTSIKTALAYSSVAHMGFTTMVCGLGLYPASLLHLTAHSFYKAHAFLSSGSVIDRIRTQQGFGVTRLGKHTRILIGALVAIGIFFSMAFLGGKMEQQSLQMLFVSSVILLATITVLVNAFDSNSTGIAIAGVTILSLLIIVAFNLFESLMHEAIASQIPALGDMSTLMQSASLIFLTLFVAVVIFYNLTPLVRQTTLYQALGIHLRNGLYLNLLFDRMIGAMERNYKPFNRERL